MINHKLQAQIAPVLRAEVIEDLHRLSLGEGISKINQNRKQDVEEMYEKVSELNIREHNISDQKTDRNGQKHVHEGLFHLPIRC